MSQRRVDDAVKQLGLKPVARKKRSTKSKPAKKTPPKK